MGKNPEHRIFLGMGSNIQPRKNLPRAVELLRKYVKIDSISSVYRTPSVGAEGPDFLNVVLLIRTSLTENGFKNKVIREVERELGRVRTTDKNAPRTIDLDILIVDEQLHDNEVWQQAHLAVPLAEFIPGYTHNITGETLEQVAQHLAEKTSISAQQINLSKYNK